MEYLLAHDVPVLTANYLLRPREVWVRRGELAPVDRDDLLAPWRVSRGLSGAYRATVAEIVKQMEAREQATGDLCRLRSRRPPTAYTAIVVLSDLLPSVEGRFQAPDPLDSLSWPDGTLIMTDPDVCRVWQPSPWSGVILDG